MDDVFLLTISLILYSAIWGGSWLLLQNVKKGKLIYAINAAIQGIVLVFFLYMLFTASGWDTLLWLVILIVGNGGHSVLMLIFSAVYKLVSNHRRNTQGV